MQGLRVAFGITDLLCNNMLPTRKSLKLVLAFVPVGSSSDLHL